MADEIYVINVGGFALNLFIIRTVRWRFRVSHTAQETDSQEVVSFLLSLRLT